MVEDRVNGRPPGMSGKVQLLDLDGMYRSVHRIKLMKLLKIMIKRNKEFEAMMNLRILCMTMDVESDIFSRK